MADYAHPEMLVDTDWVAAHRGDPSVRLVEVDVDAAAYDLAHIEGAIGWNWTTQLRDPVRRDIMPKEAFESLMSASGIGNDTTVVLYGDNNNWFAAWALWQMKLYRHRDVRLMNGGRRKWLAEGREVTDRPPAIVAAGYRAADPDPTLRALLPEAMAAATAGTHVFLDVRSPDEYSGRVLAPPGLLESCQRGGHVPGAANVPWGLACNEDGTFKSRDELEALYRHQGVGDDRPILTYCWIGERSSHSWFVLKYLLGHGNVKNYDGSWTEWGNLVRAPIETGS